MLDSSSGLTSEQLGLVIVVDDRLRPHAPNQHQWYPQAGYHLPLAVHFADPLFPILWLKAPVTGIAPHPPPVVTLFSIVQDSAPQRGDGPGGVVFHGARQDGIEVGEALWPVDEVSDGAGLL